MSKLMTVKEVANWLNLAVSTVYRLASEGKMPVIKIPSTGGKKTTYRFRREDIERWLEELSGKEAEWQRIYRLGVHYPRFRDLERQNKKRGARSPKRR